MQKIGLRSHQTVKKREMVIVDIVTYWIYEEFFREISYNDLILPLSCLKEENFIDLAIADLIKNFKLNQTIGHSSFLNMVYQTQGTNYIANQSMIELRCLGLNPRIKKDGILFHRSNLLYLISLQVLNNEKGGNVAITGYGNKSGSKKFYETLLLINNKFQFLKDEANFLVSYVLREHPNCYEQDLTLNFYIRWLKRYWHIFTDLLEKLDKPRNLLLNGITLLEEDVNLTFKEYFIVLSKILGWFLFTPQNSDIKAGFQPENISSFYISKEKFSSENPLLKLFNKTALGLDEMKEYITKACLEDKKENRKFDLLYHVPLKFFERPIFRISDQQFCIIDLKFLVEGVCSGLNWRVIPLLKSSNKFQNFRSQYGHLLESYFRELLKNIFGSSNVSVVEGESEPDAIIRYQNYIFIFEFTVEYYKLASLYNSNLEGFYEDLEKILFNKKDKQGEKIKKSKGKLINLNAYIEKQPLDSSNVLIPILVTEKQLGDSDFIELTGFNLKEKINEFGLNNLETYPPLILCLDDLELFWSSSDKEDPIKDFVDCIEAWKKENKKGEYLYTFGLYINKYFQAKKRELNNDYSEFFSFPQLLKQLNSNDILDV